MLRIRLRRVGKKKQPMYRIVVADSRAPRDGAFVESLGYYHPLDNPSTIVIDDERTKHWLEKGAMPSDRVAKILKIQGLAEIPPKLAARIALGDQRAKEKAKAKKDEPADDTKVETPAAEATADQPTAEAEAPAAEAEVPTEATADQPSAETETPAAEAEAPAEAAADQPSAETETPAAEAEVPAEAAADQPSAETETPAAEAEAPAEAKAEPVADGEAEAAPADDGEEKADA